MTLNYTKRAAVIGAGVAGLAAAIRLAQKKYEVTVFEANDHPGGKLSELTLKGYRFDAGPSLFTLPQLVDELYSLWGKDPKKHFKYQKLNKTCKYFYEDGTIINGFADPGEFATEVEDKTGENRESVEKALKNSRFLYDTLSELFMQKSLHQWQSFISRKAFHAYLNLHKLDFFKTMNQSNESRFKDKRIVQLFNRYATYNGSDPYQTPATMNIIPHLEFNIGAFFPEKGMYNITQSLFDLAREVGVKFNFGSKVEKIEVEDNVAKGVYCQGIFHAFEKIVSNMDMVNTYKKLLPSRYAPQKLLNQPKSSSALIFYWGIKQTFPELELHNIFFSQDYKNEFEYIFNQKKIFNDPTIYINITSKYKPDDAPAGGENWFVMINVPNNSGQNWDKMINEARENILKKLSRILKTEIRSLIEAEEILDPRTIESKTSSYSGALYGNSSNNKYAAFLRHANFSSKLKNLYFCGGSVHPGGGIPLCLLSAKIVSEIVDLY
ncbi:phytoene desaturase family protein [soil metagenome]